MTEKLFWRIFEKRSLICFFIIIVLFFSCILRLSVIALSDYKQRQESINSLKIKISNIRGTIFDCNKYPLTNSKRKIIACVSPTKRAISAIKQAVEESEFEKNKLALENGKPAVFEVEKFIDCEGIICTEIYTNEPTQTAIHTIGYTDSENNGVCGIEKAYNNILSHSDPLYIRYACDGKGRILSGIKPQIIGDKSPHANAVVTTIDINVQNIVEKEAENIGKGAIIVADAKNSKIRAITSRPTFTTEKIESLLKDGSSPLFNRALGSFNVGSVFKPCVAAAAMENNKGNFIYNCKGSLKIIDRDFSCHNKKGHGVFDIAHAIANSCNTYFYNLGINMGDNILNSAKALNFGKEIKLCENIYTASGVLPTEEKLQNIAHLANFSIGQGDFTASPVSLLTLYTAIANGGEYYIPSIVEGTIQNGKQEKYNIGYPTKAFSVETSEKLKEALSLVITEGTGKQAKPKSVTAAGKTATAQTGKYENGIEINSSWFCGFFPLESPKYVVIVFSEDTKKQTKSCAQIFAEIADKITSLP